MTHTAYAIRRKSDGLLLLARKKTSRGSSWAVFATDRTTRDSNLPWLWPTEAGCKRALAFWCKNWHKRENRYHFKMSTNETKVFRAGYEVVTVTLTY